MPETLTKDDIRKLVGDKGSVKRLLLEELFEKADSTGLNELQSVLDSEFDRWHSSILDALDREFEAMRAAEHEEYEKMRSLLNFTEHQTTSDGE